MAPAHPRDPDRAERRLASVRVGGTSRQRVEDRTIRSRVTRAAVDKLLQGLTQLAEFRQTLVHLCEMTQSDLAHVRTAAAGVRAQAQKLAAVLEREVQTPRATENGGEKLGHGSGGMELLRAA